MSTIIYLSGYCFNYINRGIMHAPAVFIIIVSSVKYTLNKKEFCQVL
ncbi:hypothetical protein DCCM_0195 [Desulfocucumis palustris]|uniref:Uncharacterized protein n=1 Tax=Desulfocucumis palustris TaxID=1898651 RepID=A0A2L2X7W4_9FIRM|nr:hypothetical protein DCCM_0195 [Desulfocucumis palustris]